MNMPLPDSHLKSLAPYVRFHVAELERLRALYEYLSQEIQQRKAGNWRDPNPKPYSIPGLQAELDLVAKMIKMHERLLALARDDRSLEALAELLTSPDSAQQAVRDPKGYARKRGIELPPALEIECTVRKERILVQINHYDRLAPFSITWTNDGFQPPLNPDLLVGDQPQTDSSRRA
jgi:hypothetical protein